MSYPKIITLTMNPAIDTSTSVESVAPEIKMRCAPALSEAGGGGINVSRVIKRLGGESVALFPSGGATGLMLEALLQAEQIRYDPIPTHALTRENFMVFEESSGQQFRFGMPGPKLDTQEWRACLEALRQYPDADYIVASGSLPPGVPHDFYVQVAEIAEEIGAKLILDTSSAALTETLKQAAVYLLKPNLRELGQLAGENIQDEKQQKAIAQDLIAAGKVEIIAVSIGAAGCFLFTADGFEHLRAPLVPIRSAVGAGDSMVGGIVLGLTQGLSIKRAVQYGIAAGSATVMSDGSQLCNPDDVKRLYQELISSET